MWQCTPTSSHAGGSAHAIDGSLGVAVAEVEAELGVVLTGGDELVGVRVHPGGDASEHRWRRQAFGVQCVEPIELVEAVDDDVAHTAR